MIWAQIPLAMKRRDLWDKNQYDKMINDKNHTTGPEEKHNAGIIGPFHGL